MKLVVGLGNPGLAYRGTRHNLGFGAVDYYANLKQVNWSTESKFQGKIAEVRLGSQKIILLKPTTFYNLVGQSVRAVADFYHIPPDDILVIHDDMALPIGVLRTRLSGSDAGNNGIKSLINHLGSNFARLRIGSGINITESGNAKPLDNQRDFVLAKITKADQDVFESQLDNITKLIDGFIQDNFAAITIRNN